MAKKTNKTVEQTSKKEEVLSVESKGVAKPKTNKVKGRARQWLSTKANRVKAIVSPYIPSVDGNAVANVAVQSLIFSGAVYARQNGLQLPAATLEAARDLATTVAISTGVVAGTNVAARGIVSGTSSAYHFVMDAAEETAEVEEVAASSTSTPASADASEEVVVAKPAAKRTRKARK